MHIILFLSQIHWSKIYIPSEFNLFLTIKIIMHTFLPICNFQPHIFFLRSKHSSVSGAMLFSNTVYF